jgi:hypothetical protein
MNAHIKAPLNAHTNSQTSPHRDMAACRSYPANVAMTELRTGELFAVMALRFWVAAFKDPIEGREHWQQGFAAADISDEGMTAFNALLLIVATAAQRALDVRCAKCLSLGDDEAAFLHMLGLLQRDCVTGAELVLVGWIPPAAARTALPFVASLAQAMAARGLTIPQRPSEDALDHRFTHHGVRVEHGCASLAMVH